MVIRVRPPLPREVDGERMFQNIVSVDKDEHVITISENLNAILDEVSVRVAFGSRDRKGLANAHSMDSLPTNLWFPSSVGPLTAVGCRCQTRRVCARARNAGAESRRKLKT